MLAQACRVLLLQMKKSYLLKICKIYVFTYLTKSCPVSFFSLRRQRMSQLAPSTSNPLYDFCQTRGRTLTITSLILRTSPISLSFCKISIKLKEILRAKESAINLMYSATFYPANSSQKRKEGPALQKFLRADARNTQTEDGNGQYVDILNGPLTYTLSLPQIRWCKSL